MECVIYHIKYIIYYMSAQNYLSFDSYLAENFEECLRPEMQDFMSQNLIGTCYYVILNKGQTEFLPADAKNDYFEQLNLLHKSPSNKINAIPSGNFYNSPKTIETVESPSVNNLQKELNSTLNKTRPKKEQELSKKAITENFFKLTDSLGSNNLLKNYCIALSKFSTDLALQDKTLKLSQILDDKQMTKYTNLKDKIKLGLNKGTTKDDENKYKSAINENLRQLLFENLNGTPETNQKINELLETDQYLAGGGESDDEDIFANSKKTRKESRQKKSSKKQENVQPITIPSAEVTSPQIAPENTTPSAEVTSPQIAPENTTPLNEPSAEVTSPQIAPENTIPLNKPSAGPNVETNERGYQKINLFLDDSNYDGAYLFIFKLDVNQ